MDFNARNHEGNTPLHILCSNLDKKKGRRAVAAIVESVTDEAKAVLEGDGDAQTWP